jgi:hypothetical protein
MVQICGKILGKFTRYMAEYSHDFMVESVVFPAETQQFLLLIQSFFMRCTIPTEIHDLWTLQCPGQICFCLG